jgi:hypothetical protein
VGWWIELLGAGYHVCGVYSVGYLCCVGRGDVMKEDKTKQTKLFEERGDNDTHVAIALTSCAVGLIGCFMLGANSLNTSLLLTPEFYSSLAFCLVLILQALLTILYDMEIISFSVWGWLE